jgi:Arc/MetJ-type ribon-helix-helix transcriptional regulator
MSKQIAVRLPDAMVAFIDDLVSHGEAKSRAQLVSRLIERERRRRSAEEDAAIYASEQPDGDMAAFVAHTSRRSLDHLD